MLPTTPGWRERGRKFAAVTVRAFHAYANWLVTISWKRFFLLAVLLIVAAAIAETLPPLRWLAGDTPARRAVVVDRAASSGAGRVEIAIDERGVRITPGNRASDAAASAASGASLQITLPPGLSREATEAIEEAAERARRAVDRATDEQRDRATDDAAKGDGSKAVVAIAPPIHREDLLTDLALLWVVASIIVKITYKGRMRAEAQAAAATETAEAEALKRQLVEARLAAMQAQVEPHFLFNTLASIDHLIETEPARASRMQKNLIALLRASMPGLREAGSGAARDLGHELAVVRPYLEILKMRMEERLHWQIDVPDGLLSAEFPPMMIQGLVENAIKHGLEPKADGGSLRLQAQIVHGKLAVSVADSGLGFGRGATAGTGVGLANMRERLAMLYGAKAALEVAENPGGGTRVTISVPYRSLEASSA